MRAPRSALGLALARLPLWLCGAGALGMALAAFVDSGQAVLATSRWPITLGNNSPRNVLTPSILML